MAAPGAPPEQGLRRGVGGEPVSAIRSLIRRDPTGSAGMRCVRAPDLPESPRRFEGPATLSLRARTGKDCSGTGIGKAADYAHLEQDRLDAHWRCDIEASNVKSLGSVEYVDELARIGRRVAQDAQVRECACLPTPRVGAWGILTHLELWPARTRCFARGSDCFAPTASRSMRSQGVGLSSLEADQT